MIDRSGSMQGKRWTQSSKVVSCIAQACCNHSPEGIAVYFFGSPGRLEVFPGIKSQQQVLDIFAKVKPAGTTCLEESLQKGFKSHFTRSDRLAVPTSILVITDGEPNSKTAVENVIVAASKECKTAKEVSVSFMQVGEDSLCGKFFKKIRKRKK